jgi:TorA maturation chaperone TorD
MMGRKMSLALFAALFATTESAPAAARMHAAARTGKAPAVGRRSAAAALVSEAAAAPAAVSAVVAKAGRGGAVMAASATGEWPPAVKLLFGVGGIYGAFM